MLLHEYGDDYVKDILETLGIMKAAINATQDSWTSTKLLVVAIMNMFINMVKTTAVITQSEVKGLIQEYTKAVSNLTAT